MKQQQSFVKMSARKKLPGFWIMLIAACWILPKATLAQSIELQVIGSMGNFYATPAGSLHFTLGEPMIRTVAGADVILSEGFHQHTVWLIVPVEEPTPEVPNLRVYPNPVSTLLHVETDQPVLAILYDLAGRVVMPATRMDASGDLPFQSLPSGFYFLHLSDLRDRTLRIFKLQRIH